MTVKDYRDLEVWRVSMDLVTEAYKVIRLLPKEELYALSSQMRRAAVSIPSNIAEGQSRNSPRDFAHFLSIAMGSKSELQTQLLLCVRLEYLTKEQISSALELLDRVGMMLNALRRSINIDHK